MRTLLDNALNAAMLAGAEYVDARVTESLTERVSVRTGRVDAVESGASLGIGVRVLAAGAWGFAATSAMEEDSIAATARQAVALAKAAALAPGKPVRLAPAEAVEGRWASACGIDPFSVPLEDKIALLLAADEACARRRPSRSPRRRLDFLAAASGSRLPRARSSSSSGPSPARASSPTRSSDGEVLPPLLSQLAGRRWEQAGWEYVLGLDLAGNAPRVAEQAAALMTARACPSDGHDLIIDARTRWRCRCTSRSATPPSSTASSATRPRSRARRGSGSATSVRCATAPST